MPTSTSSPRTKPLARVASRGLSPTRSRVLPPSGLYLILGACYEERENGIKRL
jgi:hypothetical protein